jgi:hypothetical protein
VPDVLERLKSALAGRYAIERELGRGGMEAFHLAVRSPRIPSAWPCSPTSPLQPQPISPPGQAARSVLAGERSGAWTACAEEALHLLR